MIYVLFGDSCAFAHPTLEFLDKNAGRIFREIQMFSCIYESKTTLDSFLNQLYQLA